MQGITHTHTHTRTHAHAHAHKLTHSLSHKHLHSSKGNMDCVMAQQKSQGTGGRRPTSGADGAWRRCRFPRQMCARHDQRAASIAAAEKRVKAGRGHVPAESLAVGLDRHHPRRTASTSTGSAAPPTPSGVRRRERKLVVVWTVRPRCTPCTSTLCDHAGPRVRWALRLLGWFGGGYATEICFPYGTGRRPRWG